METTEKKVIIVDDHPVIRDGLAMLINQESDLRVCSEASGLSEALRTMEHDCPDVAVVDVSLEDGCGIDLVKRLAKDFPHIRILVWSMYDDSVYAERAIQAGALGYINKKNVRESILTAIRTVLADQIYLSPEYSAKVLGRLRRGNSEGAMLPEQLLSDRELEAFSLIGQGLRTAQIAERMNLTSTTIDTYRARIKEKLDLKHAAQLVHEATVWFLRNG